MPASIRATTTIEGNSVTLNVAAMTIGPPPPPPPFRVLLGRRGATVVIKKGTIDITIDIPSDATKPVTVNARGRVVCNGPMGAAPKARAAKKRSGGKKASKSTGGATTRGMTIGPPPDDKGL